MRAFLCSIDESIWDVIDINWTRPEEAKSTWDKATLVASNANSKALNAIDVGWTRPEAAKSTWDKAALAARNANSKALNTIFYGESLDEFHRISHVTIAKEAWKILETTYEGTKKVKDNKLQMLTT